MRIRLKDLLATKPTTSITTLGNKRLSNLKSTRKICGVVVICKYNEELGSIGAAHAAPVE
jgi:hypothetical protein